MNAHTPETTKSARSVLLYVLTIFGLWSIYVAVGYGHVEQFGPIAKPFVNELVRALIFVLPVVVLLRAVGVSRPLAYLKLESNLRLGLLWGALVACALLAVNAWLASVTSQKFQIHAVPGEAFFTSLGVAVLIEEVAFRGFLLQQFSELTGFWAANVGSAALFAAIHVPGWLLVDGADIYPDKVGHIASIFCLGLLLGFLLRRTGSLWSCFIVHAANNLASITFFAN